MCKNETRLAGSYPTTFKPRCKKYSYLKLFQQFSWSKRRALIPAGCGPHCFTVWSLFSLKSVGKLLNVQMADNVAQPFNMVGGSWTHGT